MNTDRLNNILERLRRLDGEPSDVEVKLAAGGFPDSAMATMCAFANRPGGGTLLLGIDEAAGFAVRGVSNPTSMAATLASKARDGFEPPIAVEVEIDENLSVVVATIHETLPSQKPCRRRGSGESFLRFGDGDFRLSEAEMEGFVANRTRPRFDQAAVPEATQDVFDRALTDELCAAARRGSLALSRVADDRTLLMKLGALNTNGVPTVAGVLALADYPQQWFPGFVIRVGARDEHPKQGTNVRFDDVATFDGPIPAMLDAAIDWARRQARQRVVELADGHVRTEPDVPDIALRELIVNAVVHRDLAPWSSSRATEIRATPDRFIIVNPGGLWGVTVDRLGVDQLTSARNEALLRICQYLRLRDNNMIEAMASGIPRVFESLAAVGLPRPEFDDQGIRFTATIWRQPSFEARGVSDRGSLEARILAVLRTAGPSSTAGLASALGTSRSSVRSTIAKLAADGTVMRAFGTDGRSRLYSA